MREEWIDSLLHFWLGIRVNQQPFRTTGATSFVTPFLPSHLVCVLSAGLHHVPFASHRNVRIVRALLLPAGTLELPRPETWRLCLLEVRNPGHRESKRFPTRERATAVPLLSTNNEIHCQKVMKTPTIPGQGAL